MEDLPYGGGAESDQMTAVGSLHHNTHDRILPSPVAFWSFAWLGTTVAGGMFGLVFGLSFASSEEGLLFGFLFAGVPAAFIHSTFAVLTWTFWLYRFRVLLAGLAGGLTGVAAAGGLSGSAIIPSPPALIAGVLGAIGSTLAGALHARWERRQRTDAENAKKERWQYSLRGLFLRMTVLAMLIFLWKILVVGLFSL